MKTGTVVGGLLGAALLGWIFWPSEAEAAVLPGPGPKGEDVNGKCPNNLVRAIQVNGLDGQIVCPFGTTPIIAEKDLTEGMCACAKIDTSVPINLTHPADGEKYVLVAKMRGGTGAHPNDPTTPRATLGDYSAASVCFSAIACDSSDYFLYGSNEIPAPGDTPASRWADTVKAEPVIFKDVVWVAVYDDKGNLGTIDGEPYFEFMKPGI